ncbi:F0F1 ATP synthase subunit B [Candidatus Spongiihabitans sp.]|uniref:F0F1 ATP synthase subunit B n=1 Tax=Candidatus Spongiihabitans sp. TaxID=3101308 RepID=UPI003C6FCBAF
MNLNLTLAFQVLFFIGFVWFSKKFVWTPIIGALHQRKTQIADGLAAAEKGQMAEQQGHDQAQRVIAEAKNQANKIVGKAEKRGAELVDEARDNAKQEGERIAAAAQAEIDTELNKAKETLRRQVGELAVAGARQILKREVDGKAHAELLDDLAGKL